MIYLTLIGALVVTHAMLWHLTSRRCIIIIIVGGDVKPYSLTEMGT